MLRHLLCMSGDNYMTMTCRVFGQYIYQSKCKSK